MLDSVNFVHFFTISVLVSVFCILVMLLSFIFCASFIIGPVLLNQCVNKWGIELSRMIIKSFKLTKVQWQDLVLYIPEMSTSMSKF